MARLGASWQPLGPLAAARGSVGITGASQVGQYNWGSLSSRAALATIDARAALVKDLNQSAQAPKCPVTDHTPAGRLWRCVLVPVACPIGAPVGPAGDPCPPLCAETCAQPLLCTSLDRCCCRACLHLRHFWHHHRIGLRNRRFQVRILVPAFGCAPIRRAERDVGVRLVPMAASDSLDDPLRGRLARRPCPRSHSHTFGPRSVDERVRG